MMRLLCWLLLLLLPGVVLAEAPRLRIDPATPLLGRPLTIVIPLPDEETVLAGLPDLGPFEPLAPPVFTANEIRLVVLPLRPGPQTIPPFPLQLGTSRQLNTAPLKVTVLEGIPQKAKPAPLKTLPLAIVGLERRWLPVLLALPLLAVALWWGWRWWRQPRFERLAVAAQLRQLQQRLTALAPTPRQQQLLAEVVERRFGPLVSERAEILALHAAVRQLEEGA